MAKQEIYVSIDIEADGPIPGPHSMLSLGAAAFDSEKTLLSTFSINLETLPGASGHPRTMEWWATQKEAWEACRKDLIPPEDAMKRFDTWARALPGRPVFIGYPVAYDFCFVHWYLLRFTGETPFSHSALDIKTFAMCLLGIPYRETSKRNMPKHWLSQKPHTHLAIDDAIEQGELFLNMLAEQAKFQQKLRFIRE